MDDAIGVASAILTNGQYACEVTVNEDTVFVLTGVVGLRYVQEVVKASVYCRHDAAIVAAMLKHGLDLDMAAMVLMEHRRRRPRVVDAATSPLKFQPGVSNEGKAFVHVYLKGEAISQWTPRDTLGHAMYVLEVMAASGADNTLFRTLVNDFNLPDPTVRTIIDSLGEHIESIDISDPE